MTIPSRISLVACPTLILAATFLLSPSEAAQASKKKKKAPAPPAVTAGQRAAALERVNQALDDSAHAALNQPAALAPVFEQLLRLSAKQSRDPVHIIHFGDSHTAADAWTGALRELFQQRFGDGGSGFSVAGHPFKGYRRLDAPSGATALWESDGLRTANGDGYFGLGGISITATRRGQSVYLDANCDRIEIDYMQQPGGGAVEFSDAENAAPTREFSTDGPLAPAFITYEVTAGQHRFTLRTVGSHPVRLFGWVADKDAGVTYEALGINGAEAAVMLRWNQDMLATYLQRRNPGLIVLSYGTNEASDPAWSPESYQEMYSSLLEHLRRAAPATSILTLGPGDRWIKNHGAWRIVPGIDGIIAAQRAASKQNRCAFWDTRARMGGRGSMKDWETAGLGQTDRVHFTDAGYHRLASALFDDLMRQYEIYKKTRQDIDKAPQYAN